LSGLRLQITASVDRSAASAPRGAPGAPPEPCAGRQRGACITACGARPSPPWDRARSGLLARVAVLLVLTRSAQRPLVLHVDEALTLRRLLERVDELPERVAERGHAGGGEHHQQHEEDDEQLSESQTRHGAVHTIPRAVGARKRLERRGIWFGRC